MIDEGKEKIVFQKEDKDVLLGHLRPLSESYYRKFGPDNECFEIQVNFWDKFFKEECEAESLIYGNDKNEREKRIGLSKMIEERLAFLKKNENLEGIENLQGSGIYRQSILEAPNNVKFN